MNPYVIEGGQAGKDRLRLLAEVMKPTTSRLLERLVRPGMACLDVGCGGGDGTLLLAGMVGPSGRVLGVDFDRDILPLAEADARQAHINHVEYCWADAQNLQLPAEFDLVFARFLLTHLRNARQGLAGMIAAARPGGWIASEDIDFTGLFCYPDVPAYRRYGELYQEVVRRHGADPNLGQKLPALFLDAGLEEVQLEVVQPMFRKGPGKRLPAVTVARIADSLTAEGLASPDEIEAMVAELEDYARDERTLMGAPRIIQCSGRRPE